MGRVRRTPQSKVDYLEIWLYVANDSIDAADRLVKTFDDKLKLLADNPGIGPVRDDLARELRSFPVGSYVIYYRPVKGGIELMRILHGARDARRAFRRRR